MYGLFWITFIPGNKFDTLKRILCSKGPSVSIACIDNTFSIGLLLNRILESLKGTGGCGVVGRVVVDTACDSSGENDRGRGVLYRIGSVDLCVGCWKYVRWLFLGVCGCGYEYSLYTLWCCGVRSIWSRTGNEATENYNINCFVSEINKGLFLIGWEKQAASVSEPNPSPLPSAGDGGTLKAPPLGNNGALWIYFLLLMINVVPTVTGPRTSTCRSRMKTDAIVIDIVLDCWGSIHDWLSILRPVARGENSPQKLLQEFSFSRTEHFLSIRTRSVSLFHLFF